MRRRLAWMPISLSSRSGLSPVQRGETMGLHTYVAGKQRSLLALVFERCRRTAGCVGIPGVVLGVAVTCSAIAGQEQPSDSSESSHDMPLLPCCACDNASGASVTRCHTPVRVSRQRQNCARKLLEEFVWSSVISSCFPPFGHRLSVQSSGFQ